jgi:hypothetical protein
LRSLIHDGAETKPHAIAVAERLEEDRAVSEPAATAMCAEHLSRIAYAEVETLGCERTLDNFHAEHRLTGSGGRRPASGQHEDSEEQAHEPPESNLHCPLIGIDRRESRAS